MQKVVYGWGQLHKFTQREKADSLDREINEILETPTVEKQLQQA